MWGFLLFVYTLVITVSNMHICQHPYGMQPDAHGFSCRGNSVHRRLFTPVCALVLPFRIPIPIKMQMSCGHLLAAGLDGGNTIILVHSRTRMQIKSRLAHQKETDIFGCPFSFFNREFYSVTDWLLICVLNGVMMKKKQRSDPLWNLFTSRSIFPD